MRFTYCNSDYAVLAVVLERATGQGYHDVVRRLVLEPAGLEHTGFLPLNDLPGDVALGYLNPEGNLVNTLHLPVLAAGDGGAFTTATDLHRFWGPDGGADRLAGHARPDDRGSARRARGGDAQCRWVSGCTARTQP